MKSNQTIKWGERPLVMGILNVTPDSFSGDGLLFDFDTVERAIPQARRFIESGVDILDIGGESTRPGASIVNEKEELERIVPVIKALRSEFPDVLISIDTYKAGVAQKALEAGANWINDVWGFKADKALALVAANANVPVVLMHNRSKPSNTDLQEKLGGRYIGMEYDDLLGDICRELLESVEIALQAGVSKHNIILDPGIGFGKTVEQNLELLNRLDEIKALGFPVLLGPSRKSFIGFTLDKPPQERLFGTAAAVSIGIARGADIVRVHDVPEMIDVVRMTYAIIRR